MKKYLIALGVIGALAFAPIAYAALSFVQATTTTGGAVTSAIMGAHTTAGNTIIIAAGESGGSTVTTPTDNAGNTYTLVATTTRSGGEMIGMWYVTNALAIVTSTCFASPAGTSLHCNLFEISGVATSNPLDGTSTAFYSAGNVTDWSSTPITTTNGNDILIYWGRGSVNQTTYTPGVNYTLPSNATTVRSAMTYQIVSSPLTNTTTTITSGAAANYDTIFAAFKQAAAVSSTADVVINDGVVIKDGVTIN